jgi:hypothetical protein
LRLEQAALLGLLVHAALLPISLAGMQIGLAMALAALVLLRLGGRRGVWSHTPLDLPVLAFCGAAVVSLGLGTLAGSPPVGWHEATLWRSAASSLVIVSVLDLHRGEPGGPERARREALLVLGVWAAAAMVPSLLAWAQHYTGLDPLFALGLRKTAVVAEAPHYPGRFSAIGFFRWYQRLAHNLTPPVCLAAGLAVFGGVPARPRRFLAVASVVATAAIVLSFARSAWLGLFAAAVLLALLAGRRIALYALPAVAALSLLLVLLNPGIRGRVANLLDPGGRKGPWIVCEAVVRDHPLTGVGFGNLPQRSIPYYEQLAPWMPLRAWCHNSFFSAWAEGGPLLALGVLVFWAGLAWAFARKYRGGDRLGRAAAAGALAAVLAMFVNSLAHDLFYASESMYGLGFALGVAMALRRAPGGEGTA